MLRILRQSQRWLMAAVILLVGGVFVLYLGLGGPPGAPGGDFTVVAVAGRRYGPRDLQRVRENQERQYREALGDAFDASRLAEQLDAAAAGTLLQVGVLAHEAERLGLRVTDAEIRRELRNTPGALDADGRLRADALRAFAQAEYGSERRFVDWERDRMLAGKLLQTIDAGVSVSEAEVRDAVRQRLEEIRLAWVGLAAAEAAADAAIDEQAVDRLLAEQPERARAWYDDHPDLYHSPERVRARHILLRVEEDAPPERLAEVQGRATEVLERLKAGEDFDQVAQQVSEDPGTQERGGDLGFFRRGQMAPAFEEAAFGLLPGELSKPVRTPFGLHLIRVEERKPAEDRSFDEVRREIARGLLAEEAARQQVRATAERLAEKIRAGSSLVEAARAEGVSIERTDWVRRRPDGFLPGLGPAPEVLATAFALPDERPSSARIFELEGRLVLVQRLERREPAAEAFAEEIAVERDRLLERRRGSARDEWLRVGRERLAAEGDLHVDLSAFQGS